VVLCRRAASICCHCTSECELLESSHQCSLVAHTKAGYLLVTIRLIQRRRASVYTSCRPRLAIRACSDCHAGHGMICGPVRGIASSPLDAALRSPPRSAALDHRRRFFWPPKWIVQQPASMCRQSVTRDVTAFVGVLPGHTWQTLRVYLFVSVGTFFRIMNSEEYIRLRA